LKGILIVSLILIIIFLGIVAINNKIYEEDSVSRVSHSISEAKERNVYIKEIRIVPNQLLIGTRNLVLKECWIEEKTQVKFRFLFFKSVNKLGSYNLCLSLKNTTQNVSNLYFRKEGAEYHFSELGSIYVYSLDSLNAPELKVDILQEKSLGKYQKVCQISLLF
jgi:hypothetical protein